MCATLADSVALTCINTAKVSQSIGSIPGLSYKTTRHLRAKTHHSGAAETLQTHTCYTIRPFPELIERSPIAIFNFLSFATELAPMIRYGALLVRLCAT